MAQYGTWLSYGGAARIWLAVVLLAAAAGVVYAGTRLALPARAARPGKAAAAFLVTSWLLAIMTFLVCVVVYAEQEHQERLARLPPEDPVTPVTLIGSGVIFFVILVSSKRGWKAALAGGVIASLAAPMIFELPFDLIVMARTYPPIPPYPGLYRALFFLPLFLVEVTTLSFLTLSPMVRLSRVTCYLFAAMLTVFAIWGLTGFGYPSAPVPIALNVVSKLLALATALSLYLPPQPPDVSPPGPGEPARTGLSAA